MLCKLVSWDDVYSLSKRLASKIVDSRFEVDTIVALARSGFVPGRIISDFLGVTDLVSLKVEHWLNLTGKHQEEANIPYKIPFRIGGKKILIVDDLVDTGKSMKASVEYLNGFNPHDIKTAVMQYITTSSIRPDYYVTEVKDWVWFIYPWNFFEDVSNLASRIFKVETEGISIGRLLEIMNENYELTLGEDRLIEVLSLMHRKNVIRELSGRWRIIE